MKRIQYIVLLAISVVACTSDPIRTNRVEEDRKISRIEYDYVNPRSTDYFEEYGYSDGKLVSISLFYEGESLPYGRTEIAYKEYEEIRTNISFYRNDETVEPVVNSYTKNTYYDLAHKVMKESLNVGTSGTSRYVYEVDNKGRVIQSTYYDSYSTLSSRTTYTYGEKTRDGVSESLRGGKWVQTSTSHIEYIDDNWNLPAIVKYYYPEGGYTNTNYFSYDSKNRLIERQVDEDGVTYYRYLYEYDDNCKIEIYYSRNQSSGELEHYITVTTYYLD